MDILVFGWSDYCLFASLLGASLLIGFYFGFYSKQNSVNEYLFGGKTMGYIPVATSVLASMFSGITLLGVPTEVYLYGSYYFYTVLNIIAAGLFTAYVSMPLFYKLQVASVYEYLELRFSSKVRKFASLLYIASLMIHVPIVIYGPAIAFSQFTGYSFHVITPVICIICITYTTMGGVKAVVWTDTIQFIFTLAGLIAILFVGVKSIGFFKIWRIAARGQRLDILDFNLDPFVRNTFWSMSVGMFFTSISYGSVGQKFVQRYLSIGNLEDINKAVVLKTIGTLFVNVSATFIGIIMYAEYHDCDPISAKAVKRKDQILPYYVMDITQNLPGVFGVFLAAVASSGLSSMSASINSLSGVIYDNFIDEWIPESSCKDAKAAKIMKIISVIVGVVSIASIFVLEHMGTILEMSFSIRGAVDGPLLGLFFLGMFFPWVGNKGALTGGSIGLIKMLWIVIGSKWHTINKRIDHPSLPISTANCSFSINENIFESVTVPPLDPEDEPLTIFRLSFYYFILFGSMITVITGIITSFLIGESNLSQVDPNHITPLMRRFLPKKNYEEVAIDEVTQEPKIHATNN